MNYIEKALESEKNLSITEFIETVEFAIPINEIKNICNFSNLEKIYITDDIIKYFGYSGDLSDQKKQFLETLANKFKENRDYSIFNNAEYEKIYQNNIGWPRPDEFIGKNHIKHIIFKESRKIKKMFIRMEELLINYWKYQTAFCKKKFDDELEKIHALEFNKRELRLSEIRALEDRLEAKYRVGCIYFIKDAEYVKIGWTFDLRRQFGDIQLGNPRQLVLENYYFTDFPEAEEKLLHAKYANFRVRGDWFKF